jgi:CIC family chloride channel protein
MAHQTSRSSRLNGFDLRNLWQGKLRQNTLSMFVISIFIGIVAGLGAVAFRRLIGLAHNIFFYGTISTAYPTLSHAIISLWGPFIIIVPAVGGMFVVFLIRRFAPEAKGHGVPEVMDAIYYQKGAIRPQVVLIKALASGITIGSGGSVGREGPIIQMGAAFAANFSRWLGLSEWQRYAFIAAGAGAGIAATFNTPAGGVLFAVELMLPEISARTVVPVMVATGMATYISRLFLGAASSFIIPPLTIAATSQNGLGGFIAFVVLGVLVGFLAWVFMRSIYLFEDLFDEMIDNEYARHATGMLLVGLIIYGLFYFTGHYYVQGVGYATVEDILTNQLSVPGLLILLLVLKLLATSLTLGSGGSGGIFSPSLFLGATLGGAFAVIANHMVPSLHLDIATATAVGMAGLVGAGTGAVLTSVVMIAEMTNDINVLMPLIITVAVAFGIRRMITGETIYTLKLTRRGHLIPESRHSNLYLLRQAREFVQRPFLRLSSETSIAELKQHIPAFGPPPHILLTDGNRIAGIIQRLAVIKLLADKHIPPDRALRSMAEDDFEILADGATVMDVLARRSTTDRDIFVFTAAAGSNAEDVTGIVIWEDVVDEASLPPSLRARMGKRTKPTTMQTEDASADGVVDELGLDRT